MTAAELLAPRFEIITNYPGLSYNIGRILTPVKQNSNHYDCVDAPSSNLISFPEKYPHLFRPLKWWEHRNKEDMPKKLICKAIPGDTEVMEIEEWDMDILFGWTDKSKREGCGLRSFNYEYGYFPVD